MHWKLRENSPEHVHVRGVQARFLLPLCVTALAIVGIAVGTARSLLLAAAEDSRHMALAFARTAAAEQENLVESVKVGVFAFAGDGSVRGRDWNSCAAKASALVAGDGRLLEAGIAAPDGTTVCTSGRPPGSSVGGRAIERARDTRSFAAGNYELAPPDDRAVVVFAAPVIGDGG